jgi:hypothetical protein
MPEILILVSTEGKRLFGRYRHRCEDNFKMDVKGTGCQDMDWVCVLPLCTWWCIFWFNETFYKTWVIF